MGLWTRVARTGKRFHLIVAAAVLITLAALFWILNLVIEDYVLMLVKEASVAHHWDLYTRVLYLITTYPVRSSVVLTCLFLIASEIHMRAKFHPLWIAVFGEPETTKRPSANGLVVGRGQNVTAKGEVRHCCPMRDTDPRIYVDEVSESNGDSLHRKTNFILRNGGSDVAHRLEILPFDITAGRVTFKIVDTLDRGGTVKVTPEIAGATVMNRHNLIAALHSEWNSKSNMPLTEEMSVQVFIHYRNFNGEIHFQTRFRLLYKPLEDARGRKRHGYKATLEVRDTEFYRLELAPETISKRRFSRKIEPPSIENERPRRSTTQMILAEEDPKVFLEPQNAEFVPLGYMAFKISNKGQRVNPAQSVQIEPIEGIPSVAFDYIDRIDPAAELMIAPKVGDDFIVQDHNILPELKKAWSDAHERGEIDSDEFSFKMTIRYRDAKEIRFISEVSMIYSPIAEDNARRYARGVYPIIRVTNTEFKRLS
jgi:hypothetical protein